MKSFKIASRIILIMLKLFSAFMLLIINASSHYIKPEMKITPLIFIFIFFFLFLIYLTKYLKK